MTKKLVAYVAEDPAKGPGKYVATALYEENALVERRLQQIAETAAAESLKATIAATKRADAAAQATENAGLARMLAGALEQPPGLAPKTVDAALAMANIVDAPSNSLSSSSATGVTLAMSSGSSKSKVEGADAIKDFWKSHGERTYVVEIPELRGEQHGSS